MTNAAVTSSLNPEGDNKIQGGIYGNIHAGSIAILINSSIRTNIVCPIFSFRTLVFTVMLNSEGRFAGNCFPGANKGTLLGADYSLKNPADGSFDLVSHRL